MPDAATSYAWVTFYIPDTAVSITSIKALWLVNSITSGNLYYSAEVRAGTIGELPYIHTNSSTNQTAAAPGVEKQIVGTSLSVTSNLSAGDFCGLKFTRTGGDAADTLSTIVYFLGVELTIAT